VPLRRTGNHPRCGSELALVVCETAALFIRAGVGKLYSVCCFPQPLGFCSVPYIDFTAAARKPRDARNVIRA
jgi:hypothetical protein